jgi:hypothetical protein
VVNLLCTINYQLLLNLCAADVQPVREELSDVFLKEINILFELEGFPELDDDAVERVKIIAIVTAVRGKVHYRKCLFLAVLSGGLCLLPIYEDRLDPTTRLSLKD